MQDRSLPTRGQLRCYLALRPLLQPLMRYAIARRVARGKEDPARCGEKLGQTGVARPAGRLVWLHAVGLGEVLALRPLLSEMARQAPDVSFLVTSTARSSAQVMGANLPANTTHQFLPLDGPRFVRHFLNHWQPDLLIWSEQDLWPGVICDVARRGIPQAYINARISAQGHKSRARFRSAFADLMARFAFVAGQDSESVARLRDLGAPHLRQMGSLKPAAAPLVVDEQALRGLREQTKGRRLWVAASTHADDEAQVIAAHQKLLARDPSALLILAPRVPDRRGDIANALKVAGLSHCLRSEQATPADSDPVYLADSFGELGLWYGLSDVAFVGGSLSRVGGHNPWEAIGQGCAVLHGPHVSNFAQDYADLAKEGLATECSGAEDMADLIYAGGQGDVQARAETLVSQARAGLVPLAHDLLGLLKAAP